MTDFNFNESQKQVAELVAAREAEQRAAIATQFRAEMETAFKPLLETLSMFKARIENLEQRVEKLEKEVKGPDLPMP